MKRKLLISALSLVLVLVLAGCGCKHEWEDDCGYDGSGQGL